MNPEMFTAALAELERTPGRISALVQDLEPAAQARRPSADAFSVLENVWHLRDIEAEGYLVRIRRLLTEAEPFLPDLDGGALAAARRYNERDLSGGLEGFRTARVASVTALRLAGPEALGRSGHLETVGAITLGELVLRMLEHDRGHIAEVTELRAAREPG